MYETVTEMFEMQARTDGDKAEKMGKPRRHPMRDSPTGAADSSR